MFAEARSLFVVFSCRERPICHGAYCTYFFFLYPLNLFCFNGIESDFDELQWSFRKSSLPVELWKGEVSIKYSGSVEKRFIPYLWCMIFHFLLFSDRIVILEPDPCKITESGQRLVSFLSDSVVWLGSTCAAPVTCDWETEVPLVRLLEEREIACLGLFISWHSKPFENLKEFCNVRRHHTLSRVAVSDVVRGWGCLAPIKRMPQRSRREIFRRKIRGAEF